MKVSYQRHFVAAQVSHARQSFKQEFAKLPRPDVGLIIRQLVKWSKGESLGAGDYKSFDAIYPGLCRWRIGDYRIYAMPIFWVGTCG